MKFNINDNVKVRLTEQGFIVHKKYYTQYLVGSSFTYSPPKVDEEGFSTFQMWELMQIFGPYIYMGDKLPFHTEIQL